eukprot:10972606-Alexandrium_andersonii.AAC.1
MTRKPSTDRTKQRIEPTEPSSANVKLNIRTSLQAFEPGMARAQERRQRRSLKLWRGGFCA